PNELVSSAAHHQPHVPGRDAHGVDVLRLDVSQNTQRRRRCDEMIALGNKDQERTTYPREIRAPLPQVKLAAHQLVVLIELLYELPEGFSGNRNVVVHPAFHREEIRNEPLVVKLVVERHVLFQQILHGLEKQETSLEEKGGTIAMRVDE